MYLGLGGALSDAWTLHHPEYKKARCADDCLAEVGWKAH